MIDKKENKIVTAMAGELEIIKKLGKGKSGHSFLARAGDREVVFKQMHDEPCSYYTFSENKVILELRAHDELCKTGIKIPRLLDFDTEKGYVIKEYVAGQVGHEYLSGCSCEEYIVEQLFDMSSHLRDHGFNIDYFPANFVICSDELYYIDYEINLYNPLWSLENWGVYYWANHKGMAKFFLEGDWRAINRPDGSGVPIKEPFEEIVNGWKEKYSKHK